MRRSIQKNGLLGCLLFLLLAPLSLQADDWPVPQGRSMQQYEQSLNSYLAKILQEADSYEDLNRISQWAATFQNSNEWDRGTNAGGMAMNYMRALIEMVSHFFDCHRLMPVGVCYCPGWPWIQYEWYMLIEWGYYLPVAIIEASEVPFTTGFLPDTAVKPIAKISADIHHMVSPTMQIAVNEMANLRSTVRQWDITLGGVDSQVGKEAKQLFEGNDYTFRSARTGPYKSMFWHVYNPYFHETLRDAMKYFWVHNKAKLPQYPGRKKPQVIPSMLEFPQNIMFAYHSPLTYAISKLRKVTPPLYSADTCRNRIHYDAHTPLDVLPVQLRPYLEDQAKEDFCLPGNNGPKGDFTSLVSATTYPVNAAHAAIFRGLYFLTEMDMYKKYYHPFKYEGGNNIFSGNPRSLFQWLTSFNGDLPAGCSAFAGEHKFIPKRWGAEYGKANISKTSTHNHTYVAVQWNPMRGCHAPCIPLVYPPIVQ